ncbi:hypothetical protein [Thiofilum flexile]|uniref:hypothetical protein n=1 Tax=Thiofilum flexile TaxID=125627 RepID=UPI000379E6B0|nr:hypothetical protein [Thiofilum flexile]
MDNLNLPLRIDSPAIIKHIEIYQNLIVRMATNSGECKKWAIGLVSAIMVLVAEKGIASAAILAGIPIILFCFLDAYYLALEKQFRNAYQCFLDKLNNEQLIVNDLCRVTTDGKLPSTFLKALSSLAVWPFYLGMLLLVVLAWVIIRI